MDRFHGLLDHALVPVHHSHFLSGSRLRYAFDVVVPQRLVQGSDQQPLAHDWRLLVLYHFLHYQTLHFLHDILRVEERLLGAAPPHELLRAGQTSLLR